MSTLRLLMTVVLVVGTVSTIRADEKETAISSSVSGRPSRP